MFHVVEISGFKWIKIELNVCLLFLKMFDFEDVIIEV